MIVVTALLRRALDASVSAAEVTSLKSEALVALDGQLGGVLGEIVAAGGFDGKQVGAVCRTWCLSYSTTASWPCGPAPKE